MDPSLRFIDADYVKSVALTKQYKKSHLQWPMSFLFATIKHEYKLNIVYDSEEHDEYTSW